MVVVRGRLGLAYHRVNDHSEEWDAECEAHVGLPHGKPLLQRGRSLLLRGIPAHGRKCIASQAPGTSRGELGQCLAERHGVPRGHFRDGD